MILWPILNVNNSPNSPTPILSRTLRYLAGIIAPLLIAALVYSFWSKIQILWIDFTTISQSQALEEARKHLGSSVQDAIPFRNIHDPNHYIAALMKVTISDTSYVFSISDTSYTIRSWIDTNFVNILVGTRTQYRPVSTGLGALAGTIGDINYGVVDADRDGYKEIYLSRSSGGSGAFGTELWLYSTEDGSIVSATAGREYAIPVLDVELKSSSPLERKLENWLIEKVTEIGNEFQPISTSWYGIAIEEWIRSNGLQFVNGQLRNRSYDGIPSNYLQGASCAIQEGQRIWVSYWKGPIFEFDLSDNKYSVIYVPTSAYNSSQYMVSGKEYLWLGLQIDDGLLAYNKQERELRVFRVNGFERDDRTSWYRQQRDWLLADVFESEEDFEDFLRETSLSIVEERVYIALHGDTLITHIGPVAFIDGPTSDEFINAINCVYNDDDLRINISSELLNNSMDSSDIH